MKNCFPIIFFAGLFPLLTPAIRGGDISGKVRVVGHKGREAPTSVVFAESLDGPSPMRPGFYSMAQRNKAFVPRILVVPVGAKVEFPNHDIVFHNVFSLSLPGPFDLGLYRAGTSKSHVFTRDGVYRVFCNIHPEMTAVILVAPTSLITGVARNGNYRLNLPPGRYRLIAWSERSQPVATEITASTEAATAPDLTLDESQFIELPHKNKFGHDYPIGGYDPIKGERSRQ
ncbi:MAG: hypothetical protein HY644_13740 [Acidobacteria bacterium]|nr:hypothetical protein [Acidobacteriota bacterium]